MVDLIRFLPAFQSSLQGAFGERLLFFGLQGSYARGEAREGSDLDLIVVLDLLTFSDLKAYRALCDRTPERDLLCGFISGKGELLHWDEGELFFLVHDTEPLFGSLDFLAPYAGRAAARRAVQTLAGTVYHACSHNYVHARSKDVLLSLCKPATFLLRAECFLQTERYCLSPRELSQALPTFERDIYSSLALARSGGRFDFEELSARLIAWSQKLLIEKL